MNRLWYNYPEHNLERQLLFKLLALVWYGVRTILATNGQRGNVVTSQVHVYMCCVCLSSPFITLRLGIVSAVSESEQTAISFSHERDFFAGNKNFI